jgi:hypothetical protein
VQEYREAVFYLALHGEPEDVPVLEAASAGATLTKDVQERIARLKEARN